MSKLRQIIAGQLTAGTKFYLSEDGRWPDTFVEFHGFGSRRRMNPVTGEFEEQETKTVVYTCDGGYREELSIGLPVWVEP